MEFVEEVFLEEETIFGEEDTMFGEEGERLREDRASFLLGLANGLKSFQ